MTNSNEIDSAAPGTKPSPRPASRRRLIRVASAVFLIAAVAYGGSWYWHALDHESTDNAFVEGHISQVSPRVSGHIVAVKAEDNQWVEKGTVLVELDPADYEIQLNAALAALRSAQVAALMRDADVDLTAIASQSGLNDARASVDMALANVDVAKAQVETAQGRCREIQVQIKTARLDLDFAKSQEEAARAEHFRNLADLERFRHMEKTQTVSRQQVDHMAAAADMTAANLEAAQKRVRAKETMIQQSMAALATAENQLVQARAQVKASQSKLEQSRAGWQAAQAGPKQVDQSRTMTGTAKADIEKAQAQVDQARLNLAHTRIIAETSGFISNRSAEPGMFVQKGQALMALVSKDVWVTANFKETQVARIRPGQPALIRIDTYPDAVIKGWVDSIQHGTGACFSLLPAQNATGNFVKVVQRIPVKIRISQEPTEPGLLLIPGMSVIPEIDVSDPQAAMTSESSHSPRAGKPKKS
ncbi:HlyD family secretion protein [Desulfospira joergensenii]|uniref:HlyD family secretion protein n=1 Tax=Desulfospira joergensenii TaxID=53329 RepID=UPI001378181C|nr:HlyD family secretion protein [Desulfospira joergensenii]